MAPRDKKSNMSPDDDDDLKRKMNFFKRKFPGFKKKATELSVLCGNSVGFICHGPDNDLRVWPEPQDNPHALKDIVDKFNALSDHTRKHHACDLSDLRNHLDMLDSHLLGIRQHKISLKRRNSKKPPKPKETEAGDRLKVSDNNTTISNRNLSSSEGQRLGFGGKSDELGYIFRGSHETVSNLGSCAASKVSRDVGVSDSSLLDPFTLGFSGGDYFPVDPMPATDNLGVCANGGAWDLSWKDLEFSSTLFTGYDPLLGATDSSSEDQNNTQLGFDGIFDELDCFFRLPPVTDNLGSIF